MRTISKRTQYGLKAMLALGRKYREGPILIGTLAREEVIPIKFLEAILLDLKGRGLLDSKMGRKGGYFLSRPPSAITIGSIIRIIEGPLAPLPCASETGEPGRAPICGYTPRAPCGIWMLCWLAMCAAFESLVSEGK